MKLPVSLFGLVLCTAGCTNLPADNPDKDAPALPATVNRRQLLSQADQLFSPDQRPHYEEELVGRSQQKTQIRPEVWRTEANLYVYYAETNYYVNRGQTSTITPPQSYLVAEIDSVPSSKTLALLKFVDGFDITQAENPDAILTALANHPSQILIIKDVTLGKKGISAINAMKSLKQLNLFGVSSEHFNDLKLDDLYCLDTRAVEPASALAEVTNNCPRLGELLVRDIDITPDLEKSITKLSMLKKLSLHTCPVDDAQLRRLIAGKTLTWLNMHDSRITNASTPYISKQSALKVLNLSRCQISDRGLLRLRNLVAMNFFDISFTNIGDAGLTALIPMKKLLYLSLNGTRITDRSLPTLSQLKSLRGITLQDCALSMPTLLKLKKSLPKTTVE